MNKFSRDKRRTISPMFWAKCTRKVILIARVGFFRSSRRMGYFVIKWSWRSTVGIINYFERRVPRLSPSRSLESGPDNYLVSSLADALQGSRRAPKRLYRSNAVSVKQSQPVISIKITGGRKRRDFTLLIETYKRHISDRSYGHLCDCRSRRD